MRYEDISLFHNSIIKKGAFFCLLFLLAPAYSLADNWQWSGVERVVAVSDIHGAYDSFVKLLKHTGVINENLDWSGGKTHLVIDGDILDRGPGARKALDLIIKLEPQAQTAGGRVHMVLGNHEVMNLVGDLAYVTKQELANYAGDEDPSDRQAAFSRFRSSAGGDSADDKTLALKFEEKYPKGFFGHSKLFSIHGRYGKWLINKPVLLKINNTVFVHGGLSAQTLATNAEELNNAYSKLLHQYLENWALLADAGILPMEAGFYDHDRILKTYLEEQGEGTGTKSNKIIDSAKQLIALNNSPLLQPDSVIWYRGNVACGDILTTGQLNASLQQFDAQRIVIGHTPTYNHKVLSRSDGKLIRIDTGILHSYFGGQPSALIIEHGKITISHLEQENPAEPLRQARMVGVRPGRLSDDELEKLLAEAPIEEQSRLKDGSRILKLGYNGKTIEAFFIPALNKHKNNVFIPEVAAYRLDRLLGLGLIPVAVNRNVDGQPGAVTLNQDELTSERDREKKRQGGGAWCPLPEQFNLMYMFDILAYNEGRKLEEVRYIPVVWHLVLTGNRKLFAARNYRPRYLDKAPVRLSDFMITRLKSLNESELTGTLGDVLDKKRLQAILKRRDLLLKTAQK